MSVGKSIGLDFNCFDKDADGSFSFSGWGRGASKYMNPNSLGDVILLPADAKLATVSGQLGWDKKIKEQLPNKVRIKSIQNPKLWLEAELDSTGNYSVSIPAGRYQLDLPDAYLKDGDNVYANTLKKPVTLSAKPGRETRVPRLIIPLSAAPT
jgi:hypothetical protein